jgi:hypothetical protein
MKQGKSESSDSPFVMKLGIVIKPNPFELVIVACGKPKPKLSSPKFNA